MMEAALYVVVKDIPLPADRLGTGRPGKYPFAALDVGHSFSAPAGEASRIGDAAKVWKRRHPGWDYMTRKSGGEIRLWRVA